MLQKRIIMLAMAVVLACGGAARAEVTFEILALPGSGGRADFALSADGRSAACVIDGAVYRWTRGRGFEHLDAGAGSGCGVGMAADGSAVLAVRRSGGGAVPAVWCSDGTVSDLGRPVQGCGTGLPAAARFDLNADGTVAVGYGASCDGADGLMWRRGGGLVELVDGGALSHSAAVSADGRLVVGTCHHPRENYPRPALWLDGRPAEFILGAATTGDALDVSRSGRYVVGQAVIGGPFAQAYVWTREQGAVGLGTLTGRAADTSLARAAADDGRVVGWSGDPLWGDQAAFLWTAESGMVSLAQVLAANGARVPANTVLTAALDISADGRVIVGVGRNGRWEEQYWIVRLGPEAVLKPGARRAPQPRMASPAPRDTLHIYEADMLNPFPFGKTEDVPPY